MSNGTMFGDLHNI